MTQTHTSRTETLPRIPNASSARYPPICQPLTVRRLIQAMYIRDYNDHEDKDEDEAPDQNTCAANSDEIEEARIVIDHYHLVVIVWSL